MAKSPVLEKILNQHMGDQPILSIPYNYSKVGNLRHSGILFPYYFCNAGDAGAAFKLPPEGFENQICGYRQSGAFLLQFINRVSDVAIGNNIAGTNNHWPSFKCPM